MHKIIKNPRKGVTLIELVIALSVIAIITTVAISMIHSAIKIEVRAASIIEANNTAESIVEMFRYSEDSEEFGLLCNSFFIEEVVENELTFNHEANNEEDNEYLTRYMIDKGAYSIYIYYYYTKPIENNPNKGYKIEIDANHADGTQIYKETITFIKEQ